MTTVALFIAPVVTDATDHVVVQIGGQQVIAIKPTDTRAILLEVGGQVVSL